MYAPRTSHRVSTASSPAKAAGTPLARTDRARLPGLAQFLPSTWASTPEGQLGLSPFEAVASVDAAIWLAQTKGFSQWQVYLQGQCR